ncbi:glycosyltransferase family 4 protein [Pusillimonas sp. SM2304]|uniref:glycosyltransferase family 4 protein n=1 Tax=Pusillimonas sp. SM2304 TaxID=3073241 RepID=UPI002875D832|nr:glycosyltransferase family 4 protein [Pusillimonas sp. SM2304]MDS1140049.1 glycosyltransferase family 4 protein [Pusillimonas sp. SM2304]
MIHNKNIWYVHPYAGGPGVGRYTRPYALAKYWQQLGAKATVFTSANHHQLDRPQPEGARNIHGVNYEFIHCRDYVGNGVGRILNMGNFAWNLWRNGDSYASRYGKPDFVICSSPHPYAFPSAHRLAKRFKAKSVFEVRDLWPLGFIELLGVHKMHPLVLITGWLERYAYAHADAVVSLLPETLVYMKKQGLDPAHWYYVPNGVDAGGGASIESEESPKHPSVLRAEELRNAGYTVVAYTGALGRPNQVETLVEALAVAKRSGSSRLAAIIIGRGEMRDKIYQLVQQYGLGETVSLYEQAPKQIIMQLLNAVDIGYISLKPGPLFQFGISPNKLFDYMLAGLPIVSSIRAGNDPVAQAGCGESTPSGSSTDIASALTKLASLSREERAILGRNGNEYVMKNHSYQVLAQKYALLLARTKSR